MNTSNSKLLTRSIVLNRIQTPDGTILTSYTVHDYKTYIDKNGETYMVDGGNSYLRRIANIIPYTELSVYTDDDFEKVRKSMLRGTTDKNKKRIWIPLCDMSDSHLINCVLYNIERNHGNSIANYLYAKELQYRHDIKNKD